MLLDDEGRPLLGGICGEERPQNGVQEDGQEAPCAGDVSSISRDSSSLTPWEHGVIHLRHRVREVQVLIAEDVHDLRDPLNALMRRGPLTHEQQAHLDRANAIYDDLCQHLPETLNALLTSFERVETDAGEPGSLVLCHQERRHT